MQANSPVRKPKQGVRMQPWGLHTLTENILFEFSDSPFNIAPYLTARLREGGHKYLFMKR